jgi:hypothetical protein
MEIYGTIHKPGQNIRVERYSPGPGAAHFPAVFLRHVSASVAEAVVCTEGRLHVAEIHLCQDVEGVDFWVSAE